MASKKQGWSGVIERAFDDMNAKDKRFIPSQSTLDIMHQHARSISKYVHTMQTVSDQGHAGVVNDDYVSKVLQNNMRSLEEELEYFSQRLQASQEEADEQAGTDRSGETSETSRRE